MTEFEIGDLVYIKDQIRTGDIVVSKSPPAQKFRINTAGRVEYIHNGVASIRMESDGEYIIISTVWLGHWRDFSTINEVEEYLDD